MFEKNKTKQALKVAAIKTKVSIFVGPLNIKKFKVLFAAVILGNMWHIISINLALQTNYMIS